jgi:hypothetical protein
MRSVPDQLLELEGEVGADDADDVGGAAFFAVA